MLISIDPHADLAMKVPLRCRKGMAEEAHDQPYDGPIDKPNYPKEERRDERVDDIEQAQKEAKDKPGKCSTARSLQRGLPVTLRPVTCSTSRRSSATMATLSTGNLSSER